MLQSPQIFNASKEIIMTKTYDMLNMGRSSIDLYSNDIGSPFVNINSFAAYVGGSPLNISVGSHRLGLKTALLTAVGADPVGDFILNFLNQETVETKFIPRKPGHLTSAVLLGIEPPDKFPIVFYRENCADFQISIDDVLAAPITSPPNSPMTPAPRSSLISTSAPASGMTPAPLVPPSVPCCA